MLDFSSTLNGWKIVGIQTPHNIDKLTSRSGPHELSIQVYNPHINDTGIENFSIVYKNENHQGGNFVPIDPQEGNILP